jgi:integrase
MKLSDDIIKRLEPGAVRREVPDSALPGLYLLLSPNSFRSWAIRYRYGKRTRKLTIGPYHIYPVKAARESAAKALRLVHEGRDPATERKQATADTIDSVIELFIERYSKRKHAAGTQAGVEAILRNHVLPQWRGRGVREITRRDVAELVGAMADKTPIAANRTLATVTRLFNWAQSQSIVEVSPCAGVERPTKEESRERTLSNDELKRVWLAAGEMGGAFGSIVRLLILTGGRRSEVQKMRWSEIDMAAKVWTLPSERSKIGLVHSVQLSDAAMDVLASIPRTGDYLFAGKRGAFVNMLHNKTRIDKLSGVSGWTYHDLRRTMVSGMANLGIDIATAEKAINHKSGVFRGIVSVYQKHHFSDEKRNAFQVWGRFVTGLVTDSPPNVVNLRPAVL